MSCNGIRVSTEKNVDPLRIVQVAGSAEWAGGETYLVQLAQHLDRAQYQLSVICPEEGELVGRLQGFGINAQVVTLFPLMNPSAVLRLARSLRTFQPHLVQAHGARARVRQGHDG